MTVSLAYLELCATGTGFQIPALEKVVRLGELAADINRHPLLGNVLVLKGGSALNLCFGAPGRLSVDLDFNYIGHRDRESMVTHRPTVEGAVAEIARRRGYRVQRSADAFAGRKLFLGYPSVVGTPDRIEIDLNFLFRIPIGSPVERTLWQPEGLDQPRVRTVSTDELYIGKILALLDRTAPRDAWDVVRLPRIVPDVLTSMGFRTRFLALSATLDYPLTKYGFELLSRRLTERAVHEQLVPMLASGERQTAPDLVAGVWQVIQPLLRLDANEQDFIDAIHRGEFIGALIGAGKSAELAGLAKHPAIMWKLQNVRRHLGLDGDT